MPVLSRIDDPHQVYEEAFRNLRVNGGEPKVVASRLKSITSPYYPVRLAMTAVAAVLLVIDIYLARRRHDTIFVREFWNIPLLLTAPLIWPLARSVLFNINHNLSGADEGIPWSITILAKMGFQFVLFDGEGCKLRFPPSVQKALHSPLFPSVMKPEMRISNQKPLRIGLVGSFASISEQNEEFFEKLERIGADDGIEFSYGQRTITPFQVRRIKGLRIVDTGSRSSFRAYLASLDIAVFVANKNDYFYRHSGTVMDAVASGVVPIVPEFPVLTSQVSEPLPVGLQYASQDRLQDTVRAAIADLRTFSANRARWHQARKRCEISTELMH